MPQSLVINLVTQTPVSAKYLQGTALQQLFFSLVEAVDPELAHVLRHDSQNRSYSLSALQIGSLVAPSKPSLKRNTLRLLSSATHSKDLANSLQYAHQATVPARTACWWRISFLDDGLFDHLIFLWNQLSDELFGLGPANVRVESISAELPGSLWASTCSYSQIYEHASTARRDIHLMLVTPAAFEVDGKLSQLPTAEAVFQPLRRYWNRYSGLAFAPSLIDAISLVGFDIRTEAVQLPSKRMLRPLVGCRGWLHFQVSRKYDGLTVKRLNTLADFTRYCNIGHHAMFGLGVMRRLSGSINELSSAESSGNRRT